MTIAAGDLQRRYRNTPRYVGPADDRLVVAKRQAGLYEVYEGRIPWGTQFIGSVFKARGRQAIAQEPRTDREISRHATVDDAARAVLGWHRQQQRERTQ